MRRARRTRHGTREAPPPAPGAGPIEYEIDLHGMRPEAALQALERHIEANHAAGSPWIQVIHGIGTGKLRDAARELLKRHPLVGEYYFAPRAGGGEGVTIAELRRRE